MSFNPLVNLGNLNRLLSSVSWVNYSALNVTASFLGREGIKLSFEGEATRTLPQMVGTVLSPEPYQPISLSINLLKTQFLAQQYEAQLNSNSALGPGTVRTDSVTLGPYDLYNCAIANVRELSFAGEDAGYMVTITGYVPRNSGLWA